MASVGLWRSVSFTRPAPHQQIGRCCEWLLLGLLLAPPLPHHRPKQGMRHPLACLPFANKPLPGASTTAACSYSPPLGFFSVFYDSEVSDGKEKKGSLRSATSKDKRQPTQPDPITTTHGGSPDIFLVSAIPPPPPLDHLDRTVTDAYFFNTEYSSSPEFPLLSFVSSRLPRRRPHLVPPRPTLWCLHLLAFRPT